MTAEQWREIAGCPGYWISDRGRVLSLKGVEPRILRPGTASRLGYHMVKIWGVDGEVGRLIHRLVAEAFIGVCPPGLEVRHLDGDPRNNRSDNLAYGTRSDNMRDRVLHGNDPNANKTHCKRGHSFDDANTYLTSDGKRQCRTCRSAAQLRYRSRQRAA